MEKNNKIVNFFINKIKTLQSRWSLAAGCLISTIKFPHFIRKLPAAPRFFQTRKALCFFLLLVLLFNLCHAFIFPFDEEKRLRYELIKHPVEAEFHERLGYYYLGVNYVAAEREYRLAEEFFRLTFPRPNGTEESPWQRWIAVATQREKLKKEAFFWESVRQAFPDYHYAVFKLAVVHFQLGNDDKAREYIQIVLQESPTEESALHFAERLK